MKPRELSGLQLKWLMSEKSRNLFMEMIDFSGAAAGSSCWEWMGFDTPCGYGRVARWEPILNKPFTEYAHRAAWRFWRGHIPDGMRVLHECDNRRCVRPEHLFLGTSRDNTHDMMRKGRQSFAASAGRYAFLTDEMVADARRLYVPWKVSVRQLAMRFGVCPGTLGKAMRGESWSHVPVAPVRAGLKRGDHTNTLADMVP